jgi:molecular chaperone HtpG
MSVRTGLAFFLYSVGQKNFFKSIINYNYMAKNESKHGSIGVTSDNIFPIIKKFLYSDHEIFLREIVSNAVDATQKLKTLSSVGEFKGETGDLSVGIKIDGDKLIISDRGVGMTADEIDRYINQIAFSSAEEFVEKYKNDAAAIIGHFGLGFYSSFMVSKKVEIVTKSYREDAVAMKWSCEGTPKYEMTETQKDERGTDIILHIDDENKSFLEKNKITELLTKYCRFLPIPVIFGKKQEWKEGKNVDTAEDNVINNTTPAWTKKPSDLTDEDYKTFYRELYPMSEDPLFRIHLNVDYPFNLTGILYFPRIKSNMEIHKNKIQLYCNQVFVTDSIEGIVPEFMTLLHGVLDSPDIPLNVSRSYLQSDRNVKKISAHITKKVADRLEEIFKNDRPQFESKWDDLKIFIQYGMLSDEKFYERAVKFDLLKDVDGTYFTPDEYKKLIEGNQKDKDDMLVYLYSTNPDDQYSYIQAAKDKGYNVLLFDGQLDVPAIGQFEQKFEKTRFVRVDSDTIGNIIRKEDTKAVSLSEEQRNALQEVFRSRIPKVEKADFIVSFESLGEEANPVMLTQSEYMRRMKEMASMQGGGMSFYGELPDSYNLVLNTDHKLIKKVMDEEAASCDEKVKPIIEEIKVVEEKQKVLREEQNKKKQEDISEAEKSEMTETNKKLDDLRERRNNVYIDFAGDNMLVSQLIDLALLSNGMLKGEALSKFIKRSANMIE